MTIEEEVSGAPQGSRSIIALERRAGI